MSYVDKIAFVIAGQESQDDSVDGTSHENVDVQGGGVILTDKGDNCQASFLGIGVVLVPTRSENQPSKPFIF